MTTPDIPTGGEPTAEQRADALKAALTREAVLAALADKIGKALKQARAETQQLMDAEQERTGGKQFAAMLPDGTKVGTASITEPRPEAVIVDRQAFVDWCRRLFPSERVTYVVREVRESLVTRLLAEMTAAGVPRIVDPETGEIHDVPGVAVRPTRSRSHSMRLTADGREAIAAAWREGRLAAALPALAPAPADQDATVEGGTP